jgi:hypothetical protein
MDAVAASTPARLARPAFFDAFRASLLGARPGQRLQPPAPRDLRDAVRELMVAAPGAPEDLLGDVDALLERLRGPEGDAVVRAAPARMRGGMAAALGSAGTEPSHVGEAHLLLACRALGVAAVLPPALSGEPAVSFNLGSARGPDGRALLLGRGEPATTARRAAEMAVALYGALEPCGPELPRKKK